MSKFIIIKSSRSTHAPCSGPTCAKAGVEEGKIYDSRGAAEQDARKMSEHNPMGFEVIPYDPERRFDGEGTNPWTHEGIKRLTEVVEGTVEAPHCMLCPFRGRLRKATPDEIQNDRTEAFYDCHILEQPVWAESGPHCVHQNWVDALIDATITSEV